MVAITILAVIIYAISAAEFMEQIEFRRVATMPDVDATLLSIFGLGQAPIWVRKPPVSGDFSTLPAPHVPEGSFNLNPAVDRSCIRL
jgi:hypothetical protein